MANLIFMGQNLKTRQKRRRRKLYLKRKNDRIKAGAAAKPAKPAAKTAKKAAKKVAKKAAKKVAKKAAKKAAKPKAEEPKVDKTPEAPSEEG